MPKHILIVDDDALMRRSLAFNVEQAGYRVSNAANAEDALVLARRDRPGLVLLDIGLPGMDGLDALRHFKDQLGVPVIFLTARRRNLDEVVGLELGADDYITKPFDVDVLLAHVKAVLRRSEALLLRFGEYQFLLDEHLQNRVLLLDHPAFQIIPSVLPAVLGVKRYKDLRHLTLRDHFTVYDGDYLIDGLAGLSLFNVRAGHVKQFSQVFGGIP